jgi:hydroxymethylbilane synthase
VTALRLGSRGSPLALYQARLVASRIGSATGSPVEIVVIKTSGDRLQEAPLSEIGGKRLFVKEIEDALLGGEIDLAVHSSKDMPAVLPDGLMVGAVLEREDPSDALVLPASDHGHAGLEAIRSFASSGRIGTGSVRRVAQLRRLFPGASFQNVRGNLDTRLRKLDEGAYDLLVLASAGLRRLGFQSRISMRVPVDQCIPAPGQGIIAVEIRADDGRTRQAVAAIDDKPAAIALAAERAVVVALGGGCQMPIGAMASILGASLEMTAIVASLDGSRAIRYKGVGQIEAPVDLGRQVASHLLKSGAAEILDEARRLESSTPSAEPRQLT